MKTPESAAFVILGTCSFQTDGKGIMMMMISMRISIAETDAYAAFWLPQ